MEVKVIHDNVDNNVLEAFSEDNSIQTDESALKL